MHEFNQITQRKTETEASPKSTMHQAPTVQWLDCEKIKYTKRELFKIWGHRNIQAHPTEQGIKGWWICLRDSDWWSRGVCRSATCPHCTQLIKMNEDDLHQPGSALTSHLNISQAWPGDPRQILPVQLMKNAFPVQHKAVRTVAKR